jgi:hypothetical protein
MQPSCLQAAFQGIRHGFYPLYPGQVFVPESKILGLRLVHPGLRERPGAAVPVGYQVGLEHGSFGVPVRPGAEIYPMEWGKASRSLALARVT